MKLSERDLSYKYTPSAVAYPSGQALRVDDTVAAPATGASTAKFEQALALVLAAQADKAVVLSVREQARYLMVADRKSIRNRQRSLLMRSLAEIGITADAAHYWNKSQGIDSSLWTLYARSGVAFS